MLDLDISILVVFVLVWLLMIILGKLYYRPVGNVITERENKINREQKELETISAEIMSKSEDIERALKAARQEAVHLKEEIIRQGEAAREQIVADARAQAKQVFAGKMKELGKELESAERALKKEITDYKKKLETLFL